MIKLLHALFEKKKIMFSMICVFGILPAKADTLLHLRCGWYVAGTGGLAWHNDIEFKPKGGSVKFRYDTGYSTTAAIGVLLKHWRLEVQGVYQKNDLDRLSVRTRHRHKAGRTSGNVRESAIMFNGYWDYLIPNSWWVVYLGGGIGPGFHHREAVDSTGLFGEKNQTHFAWQAMAGVSYEIVYHTFVTLGWRLYSTPKVKSPRERSDDIILVNNVELGVRIELY